MIICWDGAGGSQKRRTVIKSIKKGASPSARTTKLLVWTSRENENKYWQQEVLMEMLNEMPIHPAYASKGQRQTTSCIMSQSHRNTKVGRKSLSHQTRTSFNCSTTKRALPPHRQESDEQEERHRRVRHHRKTCIAREPWLATSQTTLKGIRGAGLKTISKRLPTLREEKEHYLNDIYEMCETDSKVKFYSNVVDNWGDSGAKL